MGYLREINSVWMRFRSITYWVVGDMENDSGDNATLKYDVGEEYNN